MRTFAPGVAYRRNVGIMLLNHESLVWVGRRLDTPQAWQMPQGGIDEGEDERSAAMRELVEETGISTVEILAESIGWLLYDLPEALRGKAWGGRWIGQAQRWFVMRFTGTESEIDLAGAHGEFDAYRWVTPEELVTLIVPFKRPVYEALVEEFAALLKR